MGVKSATHFFVWQKWFIIRMNQRHLAIISRVLYTIYTPDPLLVTSPKDTVSARAVHLGSAIVRALAAGSARATARLPCIDPNPRSPARSYARRRRAIRALLTQSRLTPLRLCSVRAQAELRAAQVSSMNFWTVGSELGSGLTRVGSVCSDASGSGTWLG